MVELVMTRSYTALLFAIAVKICSPIKVPSSGTRQENAPIRPRHPSIPDVSAPRLGRKRRSGVLNMSLKRQAALMPCLDMNRPEGTTCLVLEVFLSHRSSSIMRRNPISFAIAPANRRAARLPPVIGLGWELGLALG
jgi:hypothetical protein